MRVATAPYSDLLAAGVGVVGTLLGLFYATVGVVASTIYQSVPPSIRALFVQEPNGVVYVSGVVRAATFGLLELVSGAIIVAPSRLGLLVFAALSLNALFRLAVLGGRIFNFFDPSALAAILGNRALRAADRAANASQQVAAQLAAHQAASAALATYFELAILIEDQKGRSTAGPRRLTTQLLQLTYLYSYKKPRIDLESKWWEESPVHANWMTLDHLRLEMSLSTATGITPTLAANRMWFEESVARILARTFASAFVAGGSSLQLSFTNSVSDVTQQLATRHQVAEALTVERIWNEASRTVVAARPDRLDDGSSSLNELAAAEQLIYPLIGAWLGFVNGVESARSLNFDEVFRAGLSDHKALYQFDLPLPTLETMETIRRGVVSEASRDRRRAAPSWWRNHYLAKSTSQHFVSEMDLLWGEIKRVLDGRVSELREAGNYESLSVLVIAQLELLHKMDSNYPRLLPTMEHLSRMRRDETADASWPRLPDVTEWVRGEQSKSLRILGTCLPRLRRQVHDPARPDLHGQAFQYVLQGAFDALLAGEDDLSRELFAAVFLEADVMRARVLEDLSDRDDTTKLVFGLEPVVSLMELSGLARVMQDLDRHGIWADVQRLWDVILVPGELEGPDRLIQLLSALDSVFALTSGGIMRTKRRQDLDRILRDRGISTSRPRRPRARPSKSQESRTPLLAAFAPDEYGLDYDLEVLFAADYLAARLPADYQYPWKVQSLIDALRVARDDADEQAESAQDGEEEGVGPDAP